MKDESNFYNLTIEEREKAKKDLWKDSFPEIPKFAEYLRKAILQKECPKVIALEGGYGMGKTYFSSRFCEYLRTGENPVPTVYFSAWEDDNLTDPFLSFSKAILALFPKKDKITKKFGKCFKLAADSIDMNISPKLFGLPVSLSLNLGKIIDKFIQNDNPLIAFKEQFSKLVSSLPNQKLVIIVDELDRCRPDYAIRVLETIKHFFTMDGIIVIPPVNYGTLTSCIESIYSLREDKAEEYLRKFINYRVRIPTPDYRQFIESKINETTFKKEIDEGYLNVENIAFCSLKTLQEDLVRYTETVKPSLRELTNLLNIVELAIYHKKERIRCSLLVHLLFKKFIKDNRNPKTFPTNLPIDESLKQLLDDKIQHVLSQYREYIQNAPAFFSNRRWDYPRDFNPDTFINLEKEFQQIKTYGELLIYINEKSGHLYNLYNNTNIITESFSVLSGKLSKLIDIGVNTFGIFELKDATNSKPKVDLYKALVYQLKV